MIIEFLGGPLDGEERDMPLIANAIIDYRDATGLSYRYQLLPTSEGQGYYFWYAFADATV